MHAETNLHPLMAQALSAFAPLQSEVHRVAADLNYNRAKATDFEREAERALRDQIMLQHLLRSSM